MIVYSPIDGDALTSPIISRPRHCFLMTMLGEPVPESVQGINTAVTEACKNSNYQVIDANSRVTGGDFLLKIWKLIASVPLAVGICHQDIPQLTQNNIYYELGVAQALGKETMLIKSPSVKVLSNLIRNEHIEYNEGFTEKIDSYFKLELPEQAGHYEIVADQLDRDPILAMDYLKRAFLISGDKNLQSKAKHLIEESGLEARAKNSIEQLAAFF